MSIINSKHCAARTVFSCTGKNRLKRHNLECEKNLTCNSYNYTTLNFITFTYTEVKCQIAVIVEIWHRECWRKSNENISGLYWMIILIIFLILPGKFNLSDRGKNKGITWFSTIAAINCSVGGTKLLCTSDKLKMYIIMQKPYGHFKVQERWVRGKTRQKSASCGLMRLLKCCLFSKNVIRRQYSRFYRHTAAVATLSARLPLFRVGQSCFIGL